MKAIYKRGKRLFVSLLCALLVISQLGIAAPAAANAQEAEGNENQPKTVKAAAEGDTVLTFTSDIHNTNDNTPAKRLNTWLGHVFDKYGKVDVMSFCGDLGTAQGNGNTWWGYVQNVMNTVDDNKIPGLYTTGNHEFMNGSYTPTLNSTASKLIVSDVGAEGDNYILYCLGTDNWNNYQDNITTGQISKLKSFLDKAGTDKPIIVLVHFPLHAYSSRSTTNASQVIDTLNEASDAGKKIVLLWGHNHTLSDSNYDQVFAPGSTLNYDRSNNSKKIKFHYAAAGCMSSTEYSSGSAYVKGKGLVLTIDSEDMLTMSYLDENGNDVTEGGTYKEDGSSVDPDDPVDPPTGDTVNITPSTDNPEQSIKIAAGDTLTINVTNGSSNSAYDFTASLSNSGIAQITGTNPVNIATGAIGKFTVKGLTNGTVDITIQNSNTYGSQYTRKGVIHLTVGEGGSTPDPEPQTGDTVDITPSTDNPEKTIKINVGDTLTINTTNGSSNSAYDFTASLSNSGIAQITSANPVNIATGATGKFTVKGLANGTVDITIQNSNTYGSQYTRKGVIHLTVGEGGSTPDPEPQTGDTVDITPTTDTPEESRQINVGDTLTINAKNGSSNSAYDFKATLSNSGIAEIVGGDTKNIAAGATAQFTVKGLAAGKVDITIQNNNSYSSSYNRVGIIHLTVVEAGPHTHSWDEGKVTTPATCTETGVMTYTCATCNETKTETIDALGHDYQEVEGSAIAATCTEDGKEADKKCSRCNDVITGAAITATGHDYKTVEGSAKEATCTAAGKEADQKCTHCGDVISGKTIDALGHNFGEWKTVKEATETAAGLKTRSCTRCGKVESEEIPKLTPADPGSTEKKSDSTTPTDDSKKSTDSKTPTAEELAKAPVDNSLPVINPEKIKTTASMSNQTMTIKLGNVNMDNCLVEYKEASAKTWTSEWYGQGSQLLIKGMKKNGFYQYRFTVVKKIDGQWRKSKPSNTCYRWIKNVKAKKPVAGKKKMTVKWKKDKKVSGYEIQYATNKAFTKNLKKVTVKGAKKTSKTIKGLKKGKTYYVRIRPYKTKGGKKYLGILTTAKKVKIK